MLFIISVLCFTLIQLAPFDAIDMIARSDIPPEVVEAMRIRAGLDKSPPVQFISWLRRVFSGDLGYSLVNHESVAETLKVRLPNTVILVLPSYILSVVISIILGLLAGANHNTKIDKVIDGICSVGMATPNFWVGMILLYVFAYALNLLPVLGKHSLGREGNLIDLIRHMILPCTVLTTGMIPETTRYVRSGTIGQYREDYVMVQQAFGSSKKTILFKHVVKNVLLPVITLMGMSLPMLVTGAFITESLFSWPGVGTYFFGAIQGFDYPVVMAVLLFSSTAVILGNLLADICYCLVDPRIRDMG